MLIIAIEGIDGAGKTTISNMLYNEFKNKLRIKLIKEPNTDNKIGRILKEYLKENISGKFLALLYAADRLYTYEFLEKSYDIIISDRSIFSSIAYQSIYLPEEWILEINKFIPFPKYVIYLDISPETSLKRIKGDELFENLDYLRAVRKKYHEIISSDKFPTKFFVLNAEDSIENVYKNVRKCFIKILKENRLI